MFCDEKISIKILSLVNKFIKSKNIPLPFLETVFNNTLSVFELKDALEFIRVETLFELNDDENNMDKDPIDFETNNNLFDYLYEEREKNIILVLYILYNTAKAIEKYGIISKYFEKNKNKIEWIKYLVIELKNNPKMKDDYLKNNTLLVQQHPDFMHVIQEQMIQRLGFDSI